MKKRVSPVLRQLRNQAALNRQLGTDNPRSVHLKNVQADFALLLLTPEDVE